MNENLQTVNVPAVMSPNGVTVALPASVADDGMIWTLDASGTSFWPTTAAMREYADQCAKDLDLIDAEPWAPDLYRMLADLVDRWESP